MVAAKVLCFLLSSGFVPNGAAWTNQPVKSFASFVKPSRHGSALCATEPGPPPPVEWDPAELTALLDDFDDMMTNKKGEMSKVGALLKDSIAEVCNPVLTPDPMRRNFWLQYRDELPGFTLRDFFEKWATYSPVPDKVTEDINEPNSPGYYINYWDYLSNTESGLILNGENRRFKRWFVRHMELHGKWIDSVESATVLPTWMEYTADGVHPFDIEDYVVPPDGYETFNQFFLRMAESRPLDQADVDDKRAIVAPADGGIFYLTQAHTPEGFYALPDKSKDSFDVQEAFPGYGAAFVGGPLLDNLLWFTDYHHFSAPVDGTVLHIGDYKGSYNYDFYDYDAEDPYAPKPPDDSFAAGWYKNLNKHRRTVWIFKTEDMGLVAMCAVGFWGVGSIVNYVKEGDVMKKGDYMGHFGYGGSSVVLAFEPDIDFQFIVDGKALSAPGWPRQVKAKEHLGRANPDQA